nr:tetratricopeptide repeat protein [Desulfobacula sp.]
MLFFEKGLTQILDTYRAKPFSMGQRLLTQPSVLLFYLSQIFYPIAERFSITHDVTYAVSIFQPWHTIFAISIVILMIGLSLWCIKKNPILSFAVLFYFGNHVIESTILPLEMIFEHRNYLPSLFLFLPVSMGIQKMLSHYQTSRKSMYYLLICFVCALMTGIGFSTYIRNWDWQSTQSLWQDAAEKAPKSARPLSFLALGYYEPSGQFEKAIELYQAALTLRDDQAYYKAGLYSNIASIYCYRLKNYEKAVENARKALDIRPEFLLAQLVLSDSLAMLGKYEEALGGLSHLLKSNPSNPDLHFLKAFIHMKIKEFDSAVTHFRRCIHSDPNNWTYLGGVVFALPIWDILTEVIGF